MHEFFRQVSPEKGLQAPEGSIIHPLLQSSVAEEFAGMNTHDVVCIQSTWSCLQSTLPNSANLGEVHCPLVLKAVCVGMRGILPVLYFA